MRYGIIDIGSNSIRFMEEGRREKLIITTRLGSGLAGTGRLSGEAMARSVSVISALVSDARHRGLIPAAYATSAVRDASNRAEFLERLRAECGLTVDVLSGEREAAYAYLAAAQPHGGLIDIGGASFQLVTEDFARSFPLGCVRGRDIALDTAGALSCDESWERQRRAVFDTVGAMLALPKTPVRAWTGVGGSITTLAALKAGLTAYDPGTVDAVALTQGDVEELISRLHAMGGARRNEPLLAARHDVILYGAAILSAIMELGNIGSVSVSSRDGMEGYLDFKLRRRHSEALNGSAI